MIKFEKYKKKKFVVRYATWDEEFNRIRGCCGYVNWDKETDQYLFKPLKTWRYNSVILESIARELRILNKEDENV